MIIDFHTHIFPPKIRSDRTSYFDSEPAFELLYGSTKSRMSGADDIVAEMDNQQVDVSVVFGFPWSNPDTVQMHNDYIMEAVQRHPKRLVGFCCVDPICEHAPAEAERGLANGMVGIGELAFYGAGIDEAVLASLEPIMAIARKHMCPVLIHTNEPIGHVYPGKSPISLKQIYALVKRFPDNQVVLAHWGGGAFFFNLLKKEVKDQFANTYFDTAASPFLYDPAVYAVAVQSIGAHKILFGSDYPLLKPKRYFKELDQCHLPPDTIARICGLNAANLLRL